MTSERIKEIQQQTAYPDSISVQQALLQVWNECSQLPQQETLYTEEQVIEFTMKMISQYVFGNTNIWDIDRLKESLLLKQPKKD
jgi:hypothetical protein